MSDDTTTGSTDEQSTTTTTTKKRPWQNLGRGGGGHAADVAKFRVILARVLWTICVVFALILAIAVLLIAVEANTKNDLVVWIVDRANNVDLGFFDLQNPIKDFDEAETNPAKDIKTALFNYGIAAIVWLIIGKILDKIVRP